MTAINDMLHQPVAQAIGWALLQFVWQGALIGVVAAGILAALRRSAADVRYVVATIAMSLMLTMPIVTAVQSLAGRSGSAAAPSAPSASAATARTSPAAKASQVTTIDRGSAEVRPEPIPASLPPGSPWLPLVLGGWLAGVAMLTLRLLSGWVWAQRMRSRGAVALAALDEPGGRLAGRLHIGHPVRFLQSSMVDVPTVIGWVKPVVLLPASALAALSPQQLEAILVHELAHIRRHDYLVNLLQAVVETLLFYHPAVWWLSRRIRIEREHCCDDLAVSLCGDPVAYASALADLEELRGSGRLALAANGAPLLQRIRRVLGAPSHAGRAPGWLAASVAILVMIAVSASALGGERRAAVEAEESPPISQAAGERVPQPEPPSPPPPPAPPEPPLPPFDIDVDDPARAIRELTEVARDLSRALADQTRDAADLARDMSRLAQEVASSHVEAMQDAEPVLADAMTAAMAEVEAAMRAVRRELHHRPRLRTLARHAAGAIDAQPAIEAVVAGVAAQAEALAEQVTHAIAAAPHVPAAHAPSSGKTSGSFTWSNDGERLEVRFDGTIEFTDDDRDVRSLSPGGFLIIRQGGRTFPEHTVEIRAAADGTIERKYWAGKSERPFDPEGRRWLADVLPRFIRQSGIGAAGRVARIYETGGASSVLAEIALIEGDFAKSRYFTELLKTPGLDRTAVPEIFTQAGRQVGSDFELARVLMSAEGLIADDRSRQAYLDAARSIESDFEMRRLYSSALKSGRLSPSAVAGVLDASVGIESDFELASVLVEALKSRPLDATTREPYFRAVSSIESDFERRRVLQALALRSDLPEMQVVDVIRSAAGIESDFERSQVLTAVARTHRLSPDARNAYIEAARDLGDFEQRRALAALEGRK